MKQSYQQLMAGMLCAICVSVVCEPDLRAEPDDTVMPIKTVIEQKFPGMKVLRVSINTRARAAISMCLAKMGRCGSPGMALSFQALGPRRERASPMRSVVRGCVRKYG